MSREDLRGLRELPGTYRQEARGDEVIPAACSFGVLLLRCLPCGRFFHGPGDICQPGRGRSGGQGACGKTGRGYEKDLRDLQKTQTHDHRRGSEKTPRKPGRVLRLWGKV